MAIHLKIVTPYRSLVDTDVDEVTAPSVRGQFCVLPDHDYYLIQLVPGAVEYKQAGEKHHLAISRGFAEVGHDRVIILAETADMAHEIDEVRAAKEVETAEASLMRELTEEELREAREALENAVARLQVAQMSDGQ